MPRKKAKTKRPKRMPISTREYENSMYESQRALEERIMEFMSELRRMKSAMGDYRRRKRHHVVRCYRRGDEISYNVGEERSVGFRSQY